MIDRFERFSYYLSSTSRALQKLERIEMEKRGLKGTYAQYLVALYRAPEALTASQLCEVCDKDKAAVSRIISDLENKKLVSRGNGNSSFYRAKIVLTDEGRDVAGSVCELVRKAVVSVGDDVSEEQRNNFYNCFELLLKRLEQLCEEGISDN